MAAAAAPAVPSAIDDLAVLNQAWAANASSCADAYFAAVMGDALPSALHAVRSDFRQNMLSNPVGFAAVNRLATHPDAGVQGAGRDLIRAMQSLLLHAEP